MLIDRGPPAPKDTCPFINKVLNAQLAGANAVVIVNNSPGQDLSTAVPPDEEMIPGLLPLIKISAALISWEDGVQLKNLLAGNNDVTVQLSWQNIIPTAKVVVWDLWINSSPWCRGTCQVQQKLIKELLPFATKLEQSGKAVFKPHYLISSCAPANSPDCTSRCIANGAYCAPDPDGDLNTGYTGLDVLKMNVAQLCFEEVARAFGQPWLWWSYTDVVDIVCVTIFKKFNLDCVHAETFNFLSAYFSTKKVTEGMTAWKACLDTALAVKDTSPGSLLEREMEAQAGQGDEVAISMVPTVRINGQHFRGNLVATSVMGAICAAFIDIAQPAVCKEDWDSGRDECLPGGNGYKACVELPWKIHQRKGTCINNLPDGGEETATWTCDCKSAFKRAVNASTGEVHCENYNQCLVPSIMMADPKCSCERCLCMDHSWEEEHQCTGPMVSFCNAEYKWGGCWEATIGKEHFTSCVDTFARFKSEWGIGIPKDMEVTYTHCACPPCFESDGAGGCVAACDLRTCHRQNGCFNGSGGSSATWGGISIGRLFLYVLACVVAGCVIIGGGRHLLQRLNMHQEVRGIKAEHYVALHDVNEPQGGGGASGRTSNNGNGNGNGHGSGGNGSLAAPGENAPLLDAASQSAV